MARCPNLELFKLLETNGADIHFNKDEPLSEAAESGNMTILSYLIKKGAKAYALKS